MPVDDLSAPQFFLSDVAGACELKSETLKQWVSRGLILFREDDREGAGSGSRRLFTLRRAYQVAIASKLMKLGIATSLACEMALRFTDIGGERIDGSGNSGWVGEAPPQSRTREPGELFAGAHTFLIITDRDNEKPDARLHRVEFQEFLTLADGEAGAFINVTAVVWNVRQRLGLPARTYNY